MTDLDRLLLSVFAPDALYAVGGRVREEFRAQLKGGAAATAPKDSDYMVTGVALDDAVAAAQTIGRVDVVGASFAVLKLTTPAGEADLALPRRERSTGPAHRDFAVESGPGVSLEDDLGRRDFRMNMIARRIADDTIVDPFGGVADIEAQRIDIVAEQTFVDDPLRMLRAMQFAARFEYQLTPRAFAAIARDARAVMTVSPERVHDELLKLFTLAERPSVGIELMRETGLLAQIWPEVLEGVGVDQNEWHAYDVYHHNLRTMDAAPPGDGTLRISALLHDVGKPRTKDGPHFYRHEHVGADMVVEMLGRLRFSREHVETVEHLVRSHMYAADPEMQPKTIRRFINRIGAAHLDRLFALRAADIAGSGLPKRSDENERFQSRVSEILGERPPFTVRDLAIGGAEIIAVLVRTQRAPAGFHGDARVGQTLAALFEEVVDDPDRNDATLLEERAERYILEHFSVTS